MEPGSMNSRFAWLFAVGGGVAGSMVALFSDSAWIGAGVLTLGAFLGTYLTDTGKATGVSAAMVGGIAFAACLGKAADGAVAAAIVSSMYLPMGIAGGIAGAAAGAIARPAHIGL